MLPISGGVLDRCNDIEGALRVSLMVLGDTSELLVDRLCEYEGDVWSTDTVEVLADLSALAVGCTGRGLSSSENIERSSPFHMSPHSWLF